MNTREERPCDTRAGYERLVARIARAREELLTARRTHEEAASAGAFTALSSSRTRSCHIPGRSETWHTRQRVAATWHLGNVAGARMCHHRWGLCVLPTLDTPAPHAVARGAA